MCNWSTEHIFKYNSKLYSDRKVIKLDVYSIINPETLMQVLFICGVYKLDEGQEFSLMQWKLTFHSNKRSM